MEPSYAHAWLHAHFASYLIFSKMFLWNELIQKKNQTVGGMEGVRRGGENIEFPGVSKK